MPSNLSISSIHASVRQSNPSRWLGGRQRLASQALRWGGPHCLLALFWLNGLRLDGARPYGLGRAKRGGLVGFGAVRWAALVIGGHAVHGLSATRLHPDCRLTDGRFQLLLLLRKKLVCGLQHLSTLLSLRHNRQGKCFSRHQHNYTDYELPTSSSIEIYIQISMAYTSLP